MPEKQTLQRARADKKAGKAPSTQAGEFIREQMDHIREGRHGARSPKQAIAIGLSEARRAGVDLPPPKKGKTSAKTTRTSSTNKTTWGTRKWSAEVMKKSDALDLKQGIFTLKNPRSIARSLKKSAESSHRRKADPYQSAMSMLNFEINRAGKNLSTERKQVLNQAKVKLRKVFHRPSP